MFENIQNKRELSTGILPEDQEKTCYWVATAEGLWKQVGV